MDREFLDRGKRLRVVSNCAAGHDNIDVEYASKKGIAVCNTPKVLSAAVADLVFLLMLGLARRSTECERHVRSGNWLTAAPPLGNDVRNKVLGIIGLGDIGRTVARTAVGFAMNVIYFQPRRDHIAEDSGLASFREREDLLRTADFVTVHCPLNEETRESIGEAEFRMMKPTAYFINTSRGRIVDQSALVEALRNGVIAGAGLDVMEEEPLAPDDPLCSLTDVTLLPHMGSGTLETRRAMNELAWRNLVAVLAGSTPEAVVNPEVLEHGTTQPS